jgi:two-component system, NtrC family, response regulator AtoC
LILRWSEGIEVRTLSEGEEITFGRSDEASFPIPDSRVSRLHARIKHERNAIWVEDLGSHNGTLLGRAVLRGQSKRAVGGDRVRIGPLEVVVATLGEWTQPDKGEPEGIVVADPSMRHVFEVARRLSQTQTTVLVVGETGCGKEVIAEQIHRWSARKQGPFVRLSCANIPSLELDRELEKAAKGTLLLDEIGELSLEIQAKLLAVIENSVDVRIICATHRELDDDVRDGRFRRDLYYRINTFMLRVPPLRERPEEILLLANHYASAFARTLGAPRATLDTAACRALTEHSWPGNVRELRNAMEHAMVLATDGVIRREHLPESVAARPPPTTGDPAKLEDKIADVERQSILDALELENGNQTRAARRLGITRRALIYRIERLGLRGRE